MKRPDGLVFWLIALLILCTAPAAHAQESFKSLVGPVKVGPVTGRAAAVPTSPRRNMATFYANSGLNAAGNALRRAKLNLKLVPGDNSSSRCALYGRPLPFCAAPSG
jgi:hypothetical protein